MFSFKQFLTEDAVATKRQGIQHLENMRPVDFIMLIRELKKRFPTGFLKNVEIDLKVDGMGFRFGRDAKNRTFVETPYSSPVYEPGQFVAYAQTRNDPAMMQRAERYEEIFNTLLQDDIMSAVPVDRKVVCEMLYNPLGEISQTGTIKFVHVQYDRAKLGRTMTIAPFNVVIASSGEPAPDAKEIIAGLQEMSSDDIKVVNVRLQHKPIDITATIDAVSTLNDEAIRVLQSRKQADKEAKVALVHTVQAAKDKLAEVILGHKGYQGADVLGKEIEGLVLRFGGQQVKITTPQVKQSVAAKQELKK